MLLTTLSMETINKQFPIPDIQACDKLFKAVVTVTHQLLRLLLCQNSAEVNLWHFEVREGKNEDFLQVPANLDKVDASVNGMEVTIEDLSELVDT